MPRHVRAASAAVALAVGSIALAAQASADERSIRAYTSGYTWYDNTPRGSVVISDPVVHKVTAGTGTVKDPITVAVGHSLATGHDVLDYPAGTRMYVPALRKYLVVEDTCGDGDTPEDGPCHTGYDDGGHTVPWFDVWIDGSTTTNKEANRCASKITDVHTVILDPHPDYAVTPGSVVGSGCQTYGEAPVSAADAAAAARGATSALDSALDAIRSLFAELRIL